ncbi:enoyl-CoA hydratase [Planoprotostelium fungivorum]|uniref:Probable enoyl-CoA hydratase, mitochondrial n=1 Tax=Planoprotostelium fungivorum TaxID=1890364 RepID=A0A2P6NK46_9EUKA|nr:enoyl-CoA hydratase [Planoprotostelium fungivorum]
MFATQIARRGFTSGFRAPLRVKHINHDVRRMSTAATSPSTYQTILTETKGSGVAVITLNRPKALNALCNQLLDELVHALEAYQKDDSVAAVVITGSNKAFAAGADIKEMAELTFRDTFTQQLFANTDRIQSIQKPIIAAVNGYALGGGFELAMICDMIIAGENAKFGQPEIRLGTIPGIGGTQRLTRALGKSKAMEMILTGDQMDAKTAQAYGLVTRVVPEAELLDAAIEIGNKIAAHSKLTIAIAKQAVNQAFETSLREGVLVERNLFYSTFSTKIGMKAFVEKAKPAWTNS